jgi:type IV secretory pathway ATPase VirB11/archaellum biosynthesis ATPase
MQRADSSQSQVPTILDLIANGTLSAEMAATLWATVDEGRSFVIAAIPRLTGKSTVGNAVPAMLPPDVPVHRLSGEEE